MNQYLLDTNVVSELRKPRPHAAVVAWLSDQEEEQLFLSAVTMGELQAGIGRTKLSQHTRVVFSPGSPPAVCWNGPAILLR